MRRMAKMQRRWLISAAAGAFLLMTMLSFGRGQAESALVGAMDQPLAMLAVGMPVVQPLLVALLPLAVPAVEGKPLPTEPEAATDQARRRLLAAEAAEAIPGAAVADPAIPLATYDVEASPVKLVVPEKALLGLQEAVVKPQPGAQRDRPECLRELRADIGTNILFVKDPPEAFISQGGRRRSSCS